MVVPWGLFPGAFIPFQWGKSQVMMGSVPLTFWYQRLFCWHLEAAAPWFVYFSVIKMKSFLKRSRSYKKYIAHILYQEKMHSSRFCQGFFYLALKHTQKRTFVHYIIKLLNVLNSLSTVIIDIHDNLWTTERLWIIKY